MKIEIEITDETAACLWADHTWEGKSDKTVQEIVQGLAQDEASKYRREFPTSVKRVAALFLARQKKREPTSSLLNHLRSVMACWTHEANQGDGIMEEHAGVYEEAKAAIAQAEQNI